MKKILLISVFSIICDYSFSMGNIESRVQQLESKMSKIEELMYDHPDPDNPMGTILGIKTLVTQQQSTTENLNQAFTAISNSLNQITETLTTLTSDVAEQKMKVAEISERMDNIDSTIDTRMSTSWEVFIEKKYQEYMKEKKEVLDIIINHRIHGEDNPTYIMETAEQIELCEFDLRRETLGKILEKLMIFDVVLDSDLLESIRTYLEQTDVPLPQYEEVKAILPNIIIEGNYIKVTGATKTFTRSAGFKTGLPRKDWMDPAYDYFPYGSRPLIESTILLENRQRISDNIEIRRRNDIKKARYEADSAAARRVTFPKENLATLIADYNRLLIRHEI